MRKLLVLTLIATTLALPALADNRNRARGNDNARGGPPAHAQQSQDSITLAIDRSLNTRFSTRDLNIIIDWIKNEPQTTKPRDLPPGLARQLRERGQLPPGLRAKSLPPGLADRLGAPPRGYERVVVGNDVLLVEIATGVIADILRGVFRS